MSFKLPTPKTRKEYFMAIAAGGVSGKDFPVRYEVAPAMQRFTSEYSGVLERSSSSTDPYKYGKDRINIRLDKNGDNIKVLINGKEATRDEGGSYDWYLEEGTNTYDFREDTDKTGHHAGWSIGLTSETELSGDALNVTVETSWDALSDGTPLQPKTMEEAYYADLAGIDVTTALASMSIKTRKDQYLNVIINPGDNSSNDQSSYIEH